MRMQWICRLQIETQCHSPGKGSLLCEGVWRSGAEKEEVDARLLVGSAPRLPRAFVGGDVRLLEADSAVASLSQERCIAGTAQVTLLAIIFTYY
jgi:hypothetical protein